MINAINVLSLFDGISCGRVALERAGVNVGNYYASEIDKYAIQISKKNWSEIMQLGDVQEWRNWSIDWSSIDLLLAGFPCQSWSIAGKQLGDKDPRGALMWTMLDILNHIKSVNPKVKFLFENVKMKKENLDYVNKAIGVEPVEINSALVSAQNRKRLYWQNIGSVEQPSDKRIYLKDILQTSYTPICYSSSMRESGVIQDRFNNAEKAHTLTASGYGKKSLTACTTTEIDSKYYLSEKLVNGFLNSSSVWRERFKPHTEDDKAYCLTARYFKMGKSDPYLMEKPFRIGDLNSGGQGDRVYSTHSKSVTLSAVGGGRGAKTGLYFTEQKIRKPTPIECERLQTLPDNYTDGVSDTQRYKAIGNGWTVDVIAHILKGLKND